MRHETRTNSICLGKKPSLEVIAVVVQQLQIQPDQIQRSNAYFILIKVIKPQINLLWSTVRKQLCIYHLHITLPNKLKQRQQISFVKSSNLYFIKYQHFSFGFCLAVKPLYHVSKQSRGFLGCAGPWQLRARLRAQLSPLPLGFEEGTN